jgi:hypothetical protein
MDDQVVQSNVKVLTEIKVYRDGVCIHHIKPYEEASHFEKLLYHLGLLNMTRSV